MRVLICGGRDWMDPEPIARYLDQLPDDAVVIHGGARGADEIAGREARRLGFGVLVFPAQWDRYGKAAGRMRNQLMLDEGKPDLVICFPTPRSIGTWDMFNRAKRAGVTVIDATDPMAKRISDLK